MSRFLFTIFISSLLAFNLSAQQLHKKNISGPNTIVPIGIIKNISDSALLDIVQRQTFRYFWNFGHPVSGMARERSNAAYDYGNETVTIGGSGFGIMSIIV